MLPGSISLSFRGRALVINALALSRIWYAVLLIHLPPGSWPGSPPLSLTSSGRANVILSLTMSKSPEISLGTKCGKNEESAELPQNEERTGDDFMYINDANLDGMPALLGSSRTSSANPEEHANSASQVAATCSKGNEENGKEENGSGPSIALGQPP